MDLTQLSDDDLKALQKGDLSSVSSAGLRIISGAKAVRSFDSDGKGGLVPTGSPAAADLRNPTNGMSGFDEFAAGMGKAPVDLARGAGQLVGLESRKDVADSRAQDAPLMDSRAAWWGNLIGNIATMVPAAFIPGANTMAGAGAIGAASGLLAPSTSTGETLANTGIGAAAGPAGLLVGRGAVAAGKVLKAAFIDPFTKSGQQAIAARALQSFAGSPQEAAAAASRLDSPPSMLPGTTATTAELANNAGLAQLERTLRNNPEYMQQFAARDQGNRGAMLGALQDIAGTPEQRAAAEAQRSTVTAPLYKAADNASITVDDSLKGLLGRPSMQKALTRAQQLAAERGDGPLILPEIDPAELVPKPNLETVAPAKTGVPDATSDSILQYLAKHKVGLSSGESAAQGVDPAAFRDMVDGVPKNLRVFRKGGMDFDQAAEHLAEQGYPVTDPEGNYSPNELLQRITDELGGQPSYSVQNTRNVAKFSNERQTDAYQQALDEALTQPKTPSTIPGKGVQYLKMSLNDLLDTGQQKGMGAHELGAVKSTAANLRQWIGANHPPLAAADSAFDQLSQPINRMDVGQKLLDAASPALNDFGTDKFNGAAFANTALRQGSRIASQVTGNPNATIDSVLQPHELDAIRKVAEQFARTSNAQNLGRAAGSNTGQNLVSQNVLSQFLGPLGLPQSTIGRMAGSTAYSTLGKFGGKTIYAAAEPDVMGVLTRAGLDPKLAAGLLRQSLAKPGATVPQLRSLTPLLQGIRAARSANSAQ
jgi:hypothetical protein